MNDTPIDQKTPNSEGCGESAPVTKVFSAQYENLDQVREFVAQEARCCGLAEDAVYQVQLAVDEAFANVVDHAYGGECLEEIECTCQIKKDGLVITILDCGKPFNPSEVPEPNTKATLEEREIGGLGMYFMRQLMDEVDFIFITDRENTAGCNKVRMFKRKEKAG